MSNSEIRWSTMRRTPAGGVGRAFNLRICRAVLRLTGIFAAKAVVSRDCAGLRQIADRAAASVADVLGSLVRGCITAPTGTYLVAVDYKSIEARALLWLASDDEGLGVFRRGEDPYRAMAAALYRIDAADVTKVQRQLGKVLVLGCGYQMGARRFAGTTPGATVSTGRACQ